MLLLLDPDEDLIRVTEPTRQQGAVVVAVLGSKGEPDSGESDSARPPSFPELRFNVGKARFLVVGLGTPRSPVHGGAVLSNSDRMMDRLTQQMKRRGPSLSSRVADRIAVTVSQGNGRAGEPSQHRAPPDRGSPDRVAEELCRLEGGSRALLYCSGMTAVNRVLEVLRRPGRSQVVAIGHLYNDTFRGLVEDQGPSEQNLFLGVEEIETLDSRIGAQTAAILTETITNPLSDVPDLRSCHRIAHAHGVPLVVDNTLATPVNCRPLTLGADYVVHSTTKYLNGRNDHGGGAVIVSDASLAAELQERQSILDDRMSALEAGALGGKPAERPAADGPLPRQRRAGCRAPGRPSGGGEAVLQRPPLPPLLPDRAPLLKGPGSVISFTLARADLEAFRAFYDSPLPGILKAPSLGSDLTLLCPYTLLTHSKETDEQLQAIGLPRYLATDRRGMRAGHYDGPRIPGCRAASVTLGSPSGRSRSIASHRRVHLLRPGVDPAHQVLHLAEPHRAEELHRLGAPAAHAAVHHDLVRRVQLRNALGQLAERDEDAPLDPGDLRFLGIADVEDHQLLSRARASP